jgi:hypothetical protein
MTFVKVPGIFKALNFNVLFINATVFTYSLWKWATLPVLSNFFILFSRW